MSEIKKVNSTSTNDPSIQILYSIYSYLPLLIIATGLSGNTASFIIFRVDKELKYMPTMIFLSFVCITDTMSLFNYNLNHFLNPNFKILIQDVNIHVCKIFDFIQYFSLQSSSLLLAVVTIDRYFSVISVPGSFVSKLPFGTVKSSVIWSTIILLFTGSLNFYILILDRRSAYKNQSVILNNQTYTTKVFIYNCAKLFNGFNIYHNWIAHIILYPTLPVFIMVIFNSLLIRKTYLIYKKRPVNIDKKRQKSINSMINITISLLFITFLFGLSCLPPTIFYNYMYSTFSSSEGLLFFLNVLDSFNFINRSSMFISCLISNVRFRRVVLKKLRKLKNTSQNSNLSFLSKT